MRRGVKGIGEMCVCGGGGRRNERVRNRKKEKGREGGMRKRLGEKSRG